MPDEPVSQMIRVPTPLVDAVRELARLHRQGRTKAVLEGVQRLIQAIDSEADIDINSVSASLSKLTERLDRMEAQQAGSSLAIDIDSASHAISKRLEKLESDVGALALTIQDLSTRVSDLEGVGDIGYAVTPISELELLDDISHDIEETTQQDQGNITADVESIAELDAITTDSEWIAEAEFPIDIANDGDTISTQQPPALLTQSALAKRLGCSDKAIEKHRKQGSKESFASWSRDRDPDSIAWAWEGRGGRGQPLRFVPLTSSD